MIEPALRLRRSARLLRWLTLVAILLVMAAAVAGCWMLVTGAQSEGAVRLSVDTGGLAPGLAAAVLAMSCTLLVLALLQIVAMLRSVEAGAPFRAGARLRGFARYLFLALLVADFLPTLLQLADQLVAAGTGGVDFSIDGGDLLILFVSGLLFLVAGLLDAAQRLSDEHEQIV